MVKRGYEKADQYCGIESRTSSRQPLDSSAMPVYYLNDLEFEREKTPFQRVPALPQPIDSYQHYYRSPFQSSRAPIRDGLQTLSQGTGAAAPDWSQRSTSR